MLDFYNIIWVGKLKKTENKIKS